MQAGRAEVSAEGWELAAVGRGGAFPLLVSLQLKVKHRQTGGDGWWRVAAEGGGVAKAHDI